MSPARRLVAWCVLATVVGGHAVCFALDREAWPFLLYPMFSWPLRAEEQTTLLVEGVGADGASFQLGLRQTWPVFRSRLAYRLATVRQQAGAAGSQEALRQLAGLYERNRARHHGPKLARLRLLRCRWSTAPEQLAAPWPDGCEPLEDVAVGGEAP